uniref:Uncharacterized protein n=1 Tax=Zooxanthella nutricula TaxID=1333877 RepID=A0A7S2Q2K3_9DINO
MPAEEMLGGATKPEDLSMDELKKTPAAMGKAATAHTAKISASLWWNGIASHLLWTYTIGEAILKPFGLDSKNSYMAPDEATVARIRKENPQLKTETFLVPVAGRPKTFVMSGTILAPTGYKADAQNVVSLQMSPDYSGSPFFPDNGPVDYSSQSGRNNQELKGQPIGGGVVESFAWGGSAPKNDEADAEAMAKGATVKMTAPLEPLTLGKAVGVSSAGPASALTQVGPHGTLNVAGLIPRASIWSIAKNKVGKLLGFSDTSTYNLGDGGNLDNSGVLAMLQRKAQRVIWLINTGVELPKTSDVCGMKVLKDEVADNMDSQITAIFGYIHKSSLGEFLTQNQAFALDDLPKVLCSLAKLHESGKPAVTLETLEVQKNNWWGIAGGNKVDVLFVYNSPCQNFIDKLPLETRDELDRGRWGLFKFFPHYLPVVQNLWDATALTNEQVNLLAAHAEYMTRNTRDLFGRAVGV